MKRYLQQLAVFGLACFFLAPAALAGPPKLRLKAKKSKCIKKGKADCVRSRSSLNRACFGAFDRTTVKVYNDSKKCKSARAAAKARCTRAAMFCHRGGTAAVCGRKLKKCQGKADRKYGVCSRAVKKYQKKSKKTFKKCTASAKKSYRSCMLRVRRNCKLKKALRKNVIRR